MGLTAAQQDAVTTLKCPLFIQAGAGTGKTHTLTQRLVYAFTPESGEENQGAVLKGVDEFVTITFTNKAAGELLGRIRATLRNKGLAQEALEVDSAWISTIHAMCKRILVEHALDTGIDATAKLIDEVQQKYFLHEAYNRFLKNHEGDVHLSILIDEYKGENIREHIFGLTNAAMLEQEEFASIHLGPSALQDPQDALPLTQILTKRLQDVLASAQEVIEGGNSKAGPANVAEFCSNTLEELTARGKDVRSLHRFACTLRPPAAKGAQIEAAVWEMRDALASFHIDSMMAKQRLDLNLLLSYSREVAQDYTDFKRRNSLIDTDELLAKAFALLAQNPNISHEYQDRFKLVMVDEFQDTDRLQVGIIEHLVPDNLSTLATVGDSQQSIYRFRGADLTVFNEQQAKMSAQGGKDVSLSSNYRSHDQILRFVDDLFGQEQVFGEQLISLEHGRAEENCFVPPEEPRVKILMAAGELANGKGTKLSQLRRNKARMIAEELAALQNKQGCKPGDMVILLGSMTQATLYVEALRQAGLESRIAGGSTFFQTEEVRILTNYLRALANPYDSPAVLAALMSPLFNVTDAELLSIAGSTEPYAGLIASSDSAMQAVAKRFNEALEASEQIKMSQVLRKEVDQSGWSLALTEQGAEGMMVLANIYKFIHLVHEQEASNGVGLAKIAAYFDGLLKAIDAGTKIKANPGVLQEDNQAAVRIMTIHSAKGLEFPIVAVAEFERGKHSEEARYLAQDSDGIYPSVKVAPSFDLKRSQSKWGEFYWDTFDALADGITRPSEATTAGGLYRFLRLRDQEQSEAEDRRVLYVACTRAREILIVAMQDKKLAQTTFDDAGLRKGLLGDIESAFFKEEGFPRGAEPFTQEFEFGVLGKSCYKGEYRYHVHASPAAEEALLDAIEAPNKEENEEETLHLVSRVGDGQVEVPLVNAAAYLYEPVCTTAVARASKLKSYSSIAAGKERESSWAEPPEKEAALPAAEPSAKQQPVEQQPIEQQTTADILDFGTAFHLAAQKWIESGFDAEDTKAYLDNVAQLFSLSSDHQQRLAVAIERWITSKRAESLINQPLLFAEYPFVVPLPDSGSLQGIIDAIGINRKTKKASIIDYKTGNSGEGEAAELQERYTLQATCYAYAVFMSFGEEEIEQVELVFVRPEAYRDNELEEIRFMFDRGDVDSLRDAILA